MSSNQLLGLVRVLAAFADNGHVKLDNAFNPGEVDLGGSSAEGHCNVGGVEGGMGEHLGRGAFDLLSDGEQSTLFLL